MAKGSVNKVILIGNLGRDPEVRYTPNGTAVASISLATTELWKDKQSGENQERTEWHRIVFFGKLAEIAGEYLRKGSKIFTEGRLQTRKWMDKNNQERYTTEIIADSIQMLDGRGNNNGGGASSNHGHEQMNSAPPAEHMPQPEPSTGDFEDDIPF